MEKEKSEKETLKWQKRSNGIFESVFTEGTSFKYIIEKTKFAFNLFEENIFDGKIPERKFIGFFDKSDEAEQTAELIFRGINSLI